MYIIYHMYIVKCDLCSYGSPLLAQNFKINENIEWDDLAI